MFKEYAVDPNIIDGSQIFNFLCEAFGADKGRFITDYPKNRWFRYAYERLGTLDLKDVERKTCVAYLEYLKKHARLKDRSRAWKNDQAWLNNAILSHSEKPFGAILSSSTLHENFILNPGPKLYTNNAWQSPSSLRAKRTPDEICKSLMGLLSISRKARIVEPYFRASEKRFVEVLQALMSAMNQSGITCKIEIVTGADHGTERNIDHVLQECMDLLPPCIPKGLSLTITFKHQAGMKSLHDRFLLSDVGAIELGAGFDSRTDGSMVQVSRLSESDRQSVTDTLNSMAELESIKIQSRL